MVDYYSVDNSVHFDLAYVDLPIHLRQRRFSFFILSIFFALCAILTLLIAVVTSHHFKMAWTSILGIFSIGSWYFALFYKNRFLTPNYLSIYPDYIEIQKENHLQGELERIPFKYLYRTYFNISVYVDDFGKEYKKYYLNLDYIRFDYEESDVRKVLHEEIELLDMSEHDARYYAKVVYLLMRNDHKRHNLVSIMEQIYTTTKDIPR